MLESVTKAAVALHRELVKRDTTAPRGELLAELIEALFFVSLETEEGESITLELVYLDPDSPDPSPPPRIRADRWSCVPLAEVLPLDVPSLVKIAKASDPRTSSFAVFSGPRGLVIWGLVDQGNLYHEFVNFNSDTGPERPGLFQVSVTGLGRLVISIGYETIAEIRLNSIQTRSVDALRLGPLHERIRPGIDSFVATVRSALEPYLQSELRRFSSYLEEDWIESLCRILLRAQNYRHGGAVLLFDRVTDPELDVKYRIAYPRLRQAIVHKGIQTIQNVGATESIHALMDAEAEDLPMDLHLDESVSRYEIEDRQNEIDSAIWFVSLLTRVDGLVLMNPHLEVYGFGVEITTKADPPDLWIAEGPHATPKSSKRANYLHFGTRHRSMMRFCGTHPDAAGFVISQDGHVRAIASVDGRLVLWQNLRLQLPDFVRPFRRPGHRLSGEG